MRWNASLVPVLLSIPAWVHAATLHVPADHGSIQAGLLAASTGDTVLVAPGEYRELVHVPSGVALIAAQGPDSTRIISPGLEEKLLDERAMEIASGAERSTLVEGFTFEPGEMAGTAIYCEEASPTIRGNVIAPGFGFGMNIRNGSPLIDGNTITGTKTFGIVVFASSPEIVRNTLEDCRPRAIDIVGRKSYPVIGGGGAERANRFINNPLDIINGSVNDVDATGNDWGYATTALMGMREYPMDIPGIVDGNDEGKSHRGRGKVDYRNYVTPDDVGAAGDSPNRWLLPALVAVGLALVIVVAARR
ncbi:right-handed parallel beta-helix repeat-containing protein [bacterium]|nr:right-handed parallel beta-helix repeat-containing protein [bacterium]